MKLKLAANALILSAFLTLGMTGKVVFAQHENMNHDNMKMGNKPAATVKEKVVRPNRVNNAKQQTGKPTNLRNNGASSARTNKHHIGAKRLRLAKD